MKTRLLLAGAVTAMASTALMADQVPDLLKFEGGGRVGRRPCGRFPP